LQQAFFHSGTKNELRRLSIYFSLLPLRQGAVLSSLCRMLWTPNGILSRAFRPRLTPNRKQHMT